MPRKPFLPAHRGKHFCFDERGLAANSEAATRLGQIIAEWSRAEHQMAMVLAALLGDNPDAGVALFSTLHNARAQRDAFKAIADVTITDPDRRLLFDAVITSAMTIGKSRHDLAHGVLGWSFDLPGVTLWIQTSHYASYEAAAWFRFQQSPQTKSHNDLAKQICFYTISDFNDILAEVQTAKSILFDLYVLLRKSHDVTSEQYLRLSTEPHVSQVLSRLQQGTKNSP